MNTMMICEISTVSSGITSIAILTALVVWFTIERIRDEKKKKKDN